MEFITTLLAGFGTGTAVVLFLAKFLEKVWSDRIIKQNTLAIDAKMADIKKENEKEILALKHQNEQDITSLKNQSAKELAAIKSQSEQNLEGVKSSYTIELEKLKNTNLDLQTNKQNFHEVSNHIYKKYFEDRVDVYLQLMKKRNQYFIEMHEDLGSEYHEKHAEIAFTIYKEIRKIVTENQFHISNELEAVFDDLRVKAAVFIKLEDQVGAQSFNDYDFDSEQYDKVYCQFITDHHAEMEKVLDQIKLDITKMRKQVAL